MKRKHFIYAFMALLSCFVFSANAQVAKIGEQTYTTLADALTAAGDGETVSLLWKEGQEPIAMNGSVFGKTITITGTAKVDWSKGFLFVGRGGEGNATVTFDGANLTSASNSASYGIHVSGREKNTTNKYDGTLVIKNSSIELDYLINKGAMTLDKAALTVKNGFATGGRPATETESGEDATATISLTNESKLVVNNHNGMGLGYEAIGVMNIDATSTFETTQSFLVTAKGTMNIAGKAIVTGTLTNQGVVNLTSENATLKAQEGLTVNSTIDGRDVIYADGYYTAKNDPTTLYIANLGDLKAFRDAVNSGKNYYKGVNVYLTADIDLAGENWVGIGSATAKHGFMGNFDGNGYKIKNLTITDPALDSDGYAYAGLFAVTEGTDKNNQNTIKNLTIENVTINTTGHIVSAAIAYPYYTIVDNVKVCGNIEIQGGDYTAGVLAYTRRCVNASNLSIVGNDGSYVNGKQTVGGVISDIQMNGGLTAVYSNFSAEGITVTGEKSVGGIAGIIATQTLNGATVKNVALECSDARVGIVAGSLGGPSTISNVVSENVTGATAVIGATYDGAKAVEARIGNMYYATFAAAYTAAQAGETVSMLVDLNMSEILVLDKAITLDGNGKTLTSTADRAINVDCEGKVAIKNLTINAKGERAINVIQKPANVTIEGVTATAANYTVNVAASAPAAVVAISNSTLSGLCTVNVSAKGAKVTVDNSTVNCNDNNTTAGESYAALCLNKAAVGASIVATNTTVNVAAGSDSEKGRNGAENGTVTINGSTEGVTVTVAVITYPGSDNYHGFTSLADAIEFAKAGNTITLIRDVTLSDILVIDKAITLDGNGKKLTSTAERAINVSGADGVTIKNLIINASGERAINVIQNATNVTIDNITATAANYTVNVAASAPNAVVAINNSTLSGLCTVNVSAAGAKVTVNNSTVNCNDNNTTTGESYAALCLNKAAVGASIVATNTTVNVTEGSDSMKGRNGAENGTVSINGSTDDVTVMVAAITYPGSDNYHAFATLKAAIEFAKADDVVTLIRNITASDIITINKAITLDGNGKTLTSTAGRAINVDTDGNVVIKNFAIDAKGERGINVINKAVDLTLNSVDVTADFYAVNLAATAANTKVAINRGSLTSKLMPLNVWTANAAITLDGVILNSTAEADNETYAAIQLNKGAEGTTVKAKKCTLKVTDPDSPATSNWTTTGEIVLDGTTGEQTTIVATIGAAGYTTLAKAIEATKAGETIVLLRDMTVAEKITISASVVIDGNGKTITYTGSDRAIDVPANADAKVNVTIENLTVDCTASYCQRGINYNDDGALKLNNVTVKGTNVTYALNLPGSSDKCEVAINNSSLTGNIALNVWGENSVITATNSEFVSVDKSTAEGYVAISLNNDGAGNAATGSVVTINGGKIIARDDKGEPSTAVRVETVATVNVSEETEVVGSIKRDVAIVTYEGSTDFYSFDNLQSAINKAIESKGTVVLLADVTIDELVKIEKDITIDLNGKKVTSTAKKAFEVYANTTIKNGTIEAAQRCVDTRKAVKLTLENVNLVADNYTTAYGNPQPLTIGGSENGTKVTMTNVNISAAAGYGIITFVETELTATNSTIGGYSALYVKPGSDNSVFNFVDSDLSGSTVGNDVEGNSFSVIAVRANNVTVNVDAASTVTAAGNYSYAISFKSSYQNEVATGSSVTVAGEITGNILADLNGNTVKVKAKYADKLAAAGYATIEAENGLVAVIEAVAKIGDKYFTTLEDALAAEGNKVELLVPYVVADDDEIVLDLKGKTVTGTPSEAKAYSAITNNGNLTIINGTLLCNHTLTGSTGYAVNTITNCGILTIDGATIQNTSTASNQIGYAIDNNSTSTNAIVTIKSGNVVASGSNYYDGIRQFCNSLTKDNSVIVKGGEVSSIWMQNPSDGAEKNTKDVKGSISISGGTVNILSLEPSTNFQAAVTGGYVGEISYFQEAEGRNLVKFITGGTFGMDVTKFCADYHNCTSNENGVYEVKPDANYIAEYIIDDAKGEDYTSAEEKVVGTLTYKRTLPNKMKWNPLYVPFAIPMSELIDNYDVAYFNDVRGNDADNDNVVDDGTLKMELVMIDNPDVTLNANYPFVFRAKTEEAKNLELVLDNATLYANTENSVVFTSLDIKCEVKGSYSKCKTGDKQYIVNTNGLWSPLDKRYELNPYRLILTLSSNDQLKPFGARDIRMFVIGEEDEDGTTHIFDVENEAQTQDCIYDLQGRRVLTPQKGGLYIVNGKKTVIR